MNDKLKELDPRLKDILGIFFLAIMGLVTGVIFGWAIQAIFS